MFLDDKKKQGGGLLGHVGAGGDVHDTYEDSHSELLEQMAEDLISAVHSADKAGVKSVLESLIACVQSMDAKQDAAEQD